MNQEKLTELLGLQPDATDDQIEAKIKDLQETEELFEEVREERDNLNVEISKLTEELFLIQGPNDKAPPLAIWNLCDYLEQFIGMRIKQFQESDRMGACSGRFLMDQTGTYSPDEETLDEVCMKWENTLTFIWTTFLEEEPVPDFEHDEKAMCGIRFTNWDEYIVKMNDYDRRKNTAMSLFCRYFYGFWD